MLERGSTVYGVEPNTDMRRKAEKELCGFKKFFSIAASAENTGLKSGSVDIITSAQAFHWFDTLKFKQECRRILKSRDLVVLIWNTRDENDSVTIKCRDVFSKYCPEFKGFSDGIGQDDKRIEEFFALVFMKRKHMTMILCLLKKNLSKGVCRVRMRCVKEMPTTMNICLRLLAYLIILAMVNTFV